MPAERTTSAETMKLLSEISGVLGTGLTEEQLAICVRLIETGVNPHALANVVGMLKKEASAINMGQTHQTGGSGDVSGRPFVWIYINIDWLVYRI